MKKTSYILLLLLSVNTYAIDCIEDAFDGSWPKDKIKKILDCTKISSKKDYFQDNQLCLNIRETQYSNFTEVDYRISLATKGSDYPISLFTITNKLDGTPVNGRLINNRNSSTTLSGMFYTNNWNAQVTVNLEDPNDLDLLVKTKSRAFGKKKQIATYKCQIIKE